MSILSNTLKTLVVGSALLPLAAINAEPLNNDDWLHVQGNKVLDMEGNQVWLTGANWFGFNATERTFHGLWAINLDEAIAGITERGINILRVPISTELLLEWSRGETNTPSINTFVNPELDGMNDLEVFDQVIAVSKKYGLKILLDVHSAEADNSGHFTALWYTDEITSEDFKTGWQWVAQRYANDDTLIAFDIENEPHGQPWGAAAFAKWDDSTDENNFKYACEDVSKAILAINPNVLVLCEGIESYPIDGVTWTSDDEDDYYSNWWGGNLRGVRDYPVDLGEHQDQLMYSPHDYGPLVFKQAWFYDGFDRESLYNDVWKDNWMFIHEEEIAPLLIGEWGGFMDGGDNEKWMVAIRDQIIEYGIHHTFWCLNPNSGDTGGLWNADWTTWDEEKYALFEPSLWKDDSGKFIGLDHQVVLGSSATGSNVSEYYQSLIPALAINSPSDGSEVQTSSSVTISYTLTKLESTLVYIDGEQVATGNESFATFIAPSSETDFTVTVVGVDADGNHSDVSQSITLSSVDELALPASIEILSPSDGMSVTQGETIDVEVAFTNAAAFSASFNGITQTVTNGTTTSFSADNAGTYPLVVTALDADLNALDAQHSIDIEVSAPSSLTCSLGEGNVWPGGFVFSDIIITNTGADSVSSWSVSLTLPEGVSIDSIWGGQIQELDSSTLQISNLEYNGTLSANGAVSFGVQGSYSGDFVAPVCAP